MGRVAIAGMGAQAALCAFTGAAAAADTEFEVGDRKFVFPEGFALEQVAAPPLVERPVTLAFDQTGALYVADSSGNNSRPAEQIDNPTHRIVRLVDSTGDGRFDQHTVFADKLPYMQGTQWLEGSLYVAAPPVIMKLTDSDGDGVADRRELWFDGGTVTGCGNDVHGPYAGPDGYLYWTKGAFAEQRHRLADGRDFISRASHVFRARPDGSGLDVVLTGGMDNPVDLVFSPAGDRFLSNTFLVHPGNGLRDGIIHAVPGGVWGKDHGVLEGHPRTGDLLPVMTHQGPSAASGLEWLRSDELGFSGQLLCAQFNLRQVSRHRLVPDGASYRTEDHMLLTSNHPDFHPTDVIEDADGSVLIADTGGWYKICCPTSQMAHPEVLGAIYRVRKADSHQRDDPRGLALAWNEAPNAELAERLGDHRHEVAARALALLAQRQSVDELAAASRGGSPEQRVNAVWALTRVDGAAARAAVRERLDDNCPTVRQAAATSAALWRDQLAAPALLTLLNDDSPQLQRAAAEALGRIGDPATAGALLRAPVAQAGRFGFHAVAHALYELNQPDRLTPDAEGMAGELSRTAAAMLDLPSPAVAPALPLITPAARPDPEQLADHARRLDELERELAQGDPARGAAIYHGELAACALCHAIGGEGGTFGPDLTRVGEIRSGRDLLEAVIYPSASFVRAYEPLLVETTDGATQFGMITDQTAEAITLATSPATTVSIPRDDITAWHEAPVSMMPTGFESVLSPQQLADLVAFLATLQ